MKKRYYGSFYGDDYNKSREQILAFIKKALSYGYKATPLFAYDEYKRKGGRIPYQSLLQKYYNPDGWENNPYNISKRRKRK